MDANSLKPNSTLLLRAVEREMMKFIDKYKNKNKAGTPQLTPLKG